MSIGSVRHYTGISDGRDLFGRFCITRAKREMNPQPIPHTRNLFTTSVGNILGKCEHSTYYNNKLFHQYYTFVITLISYKWYQHCNSFLKGGVSLGLKRVTILCRVRYLTFQTRVPLPPNPQSPARHDIRGHVRGTVLVLLPSQNAI